MKTFAILICVFALSIAYSQTPPKAKPFTLAISANPAQITSGMQVVIWIETKNFSDHSLSCKQDPYGAPYRYEALDESGKELPKRINKPKFSFSVPAPCLLPPGGGTSNSGGFYINTLYDLTAPGQYTIQVSRPVSDQNPKASMIYSNKITVTVTP